MAFGESGNAFEDDGRNVQREDRKLWQEREMRIYLTNGFSQTRPAIAISLLRF